jgi:hypothetical protein
MSVKDSELSATVRGLAGVGKTARMSLGYLEQIIKVAILTPPLLNNDLFHWVYAAGRHATKS